MLFLLRSTLTYILITCYKGSAYAVLSTFSINFLSMETFNMNKSELVDAIAADAEISKAAANRAIDAFVAAVTKSLGKGEDVTLIGFGTFTVGERAARTGRNPRTGEEIKIKATKLPKFRPGKSLKEVVASSKKSAKKK